MKTMTMTMTMTTEVAKRLMWATMAFAVLLSPANAQEPATSGTKESAAVTQVRNIREMFNRAIERQDAEAIRRILAPRYIVVSGRGDYLEGGDEEARRWIGRFRGDRRLSYRRTPTAITVNEAWNIAQEVGDWTGRNMASGEPVLSSGVYAARWQRAANGRWLIVAELFTTLECEGPATGCVGPDPIFR